MRLTVLLVTAAVAVVSTAAHDDEKRNVILASKDCLPGWIPSDRKTCYLFKQKALNWDDARASCISEGGDLAIIDTVEEAAHLQAIRSKIGNINFYYWVGAYNEPNSSGFKWFGDEAIDPRLWSAGEPSAVSSGQKLCVDLGVAHHLLKMNDYACSALLPYLCEI